MILKHADFRILFRLRKLHIIAQLKFTHDQSLEI